MCVVAGSMSLDGDGAAESIAMNRSRVAEVALCVGRGVDSRISLRPRGDASCARIDASCVHAMVRGSTTKLDGSSTRGSKEGDVA